MEICILLDNCFSDKNPYVHLQTIFKRDEKSLIHDKRPHDLFGCSELLYNPRLDMETLNV